MGGFELNISPWALLAFALLYFFDSSGLYGALLPAVAVHEAGHIFFLRIAGLKLRRLSVGLFGLEIDYYGILKGFAGAASVAAGPLFGIVYALAVSGGGEFWRLSGGISMALSIFNLLPVLPLDGGRLLLLAAGERGRAISRGISLAMAMGTLYLWLSRGWFSLFAMAEWLTWYNFRSPAFAWKTA